MIAPIHDSTFGIRPRPRLRRPRVRAARPKTLEPDSIELDRMIAEQHEQTRAALLSGCIPGLGQLTLGHVPAGLVMLGAAIGVWIVSVMRFPESSFMPLALIHFSSALHAGAIRRR